MGGDISKVGVIKSVVDANVRLSRRLDGFLPAQVRRDGNKTFTSEILPRAFSSGDVVYDLGGGSRPFVSATEKRRLDLTVVGLDIDAAELAAAPAGVYDRTIAADLCAFEGYGDADVVICQAVLEHVPDTAAAMRALASTIKLGGRIYIFAPSRNALFARLNMVLPESIKLRLLFSLFPHKAEGHDGFKAYYDRCTPKEIEALAASNGLVVEERHLFWTSSYFSVFTPVYVAWRVSQALAYLFVGNNAAETFVYILRKPSETSITTPDPGSGEQIK